MTFRKFSKPTSQRFCATWGAWQAIGASIAANCQSCLQGNVTIAREEGIAEDEISGAIEIGKMVRRGAASRMDKFALSLPGAMPVASSPEVGCGCEK